MQETLLIDKPLRLVGLPVQDIWGRPRRGVVLQTGRPLAIMCNARCAPPSELPPPPVVICFELLSFYASAKPLHEL